MTDFIEEDMRNDITEAKTTKEDAKELLIGNNYSRIVLNTKFSVESKETFDFIQKLKDMFGEEINDFYVVGDSTIAYEISQTFNNELNFMTIITMVAIFVVVAISSYNPDSSLFNNGNIIYYRGKCIFYCNTDCSKYIDGSNY